MVAALSVGVACGGGGDSTASGPATAAPTTAPPSSTETTTTTRPTTTTTAATTTTTIDPVVRMVAGMSLDEKIGQMLMPVVGGTGPDTVSQVDRAYNQALGGADTPADLVRRFHLGGIMYLGRNVVSPAQVGRFGSELQAVAAEAGLPPLLIAADQEGGRVQRIVGEGITPVGAARSLAGDAALVERTALQLGLELRDVGVSVDFAPVADVVRSDAGVIGNRSYGSDPAIVSDMVVAAITGLQKGGVAAVAKHWPGHGATEVDSHTRLPVIGTTEPEWRSLDHAPFVAAIDAGVDALMVGHLALPALDPSGAPATVSPVMVERYLRSELAYDGVLFTDALDMRALDGIDEADVAVLVVEAGLDVLVVPPDLEAAATGLTDAVTAGRIAEHRIDTSVARILRLKKQLGLLEFPP